MYARKLTFKAKPGVRSEVEVLADQVFGLLKSQKGFISVHFLIDEDENEYGSLSLWEAKEDAETGGNIVRSNIKQTLEGLAVEPPSIQLYEVYKPKT